MKFSARRGGAARPHQAVAENVLLADDRECRRSRNRLSMPSTASATAGLGSAERLRPGCDRCEIVQFMIGEHVAHALARALAPQRDRDALSGSLLTRARGALTASNTLAPGSARSAAKLRPCRAPTSIAPPCRHSERRQPSQRRNARAVLPFGFAEIEPRPAAAACRAASRPASAPLGARRNSRQSA